MKKKALYFILLFIFINKTQSQNSVLSNGTWYKFAVDTTGVFKIDANFLGNLGINTNAINPKNIKIYGNGGSLLPEVVNISRPSGLQENAIYIEGEADETFNNDDFILFYAKGPHSWSVNTTSNTANHIQNIYSDKSYYFLTIDDTSGKRITQKTNILNTPSVTIDEFEDYTFYEKENTNLIAVGRLWFGEDFSIENSKSFSIPFPNTLQNAPITIKVTAVTQSTTTSSMSVTVNGEALSSLSFPPVSSSTSSGLARYAQSSGIITANNNDNINITLNYNNNGNPSANAYLDYIEVFGKKQLTANNKQFSFRNFSVANTNDVVAYNIENNTNIFQVWDVTDIVNPQNIENQSTTADFVFNENGGTLKEYVVLTENDFYTPIRIENPIISNQNLHNLTDIEYLVITNENLSSQAQRLVNYHQNNSNLNAKVVVLQQIYNEFSSGAPDIVGIRDFIKHLHDNSSTSKKLKYVCFLGDSSYDYKDRISSNNNIVPTFHAVESFDLVFSYVTDDFFVMIDDTDGTMIGTSTIDIASGRIPVSTTQEAKNVIDKILSYYETESFGNWRNTITLIADDIDTGTDATLQSGLEKIADTIKKYKPIFNINKIYMDAYQQENSSGGERYPGVNNDIANAIETGSLVFNYFGHGGEDGLASERILDIPEIQNFNNEKLPLFITVTCEFSRFDNPLRETAGEQLFLNENGGAVSMITTTRDVFISLGESFNKTLTNYVLDFDESDSTIAENLIKAKNETSSSQRFFIYFFGDPAMKLAIPKPNIQITKLNGIDISQPIDTLKALSSISIEGMITNNNVILSNFNGTIATTIFDKPINKQTLDNDNSGIVNTFDAQESKLFTGKSSVENGIFKFDFIVPKDAKIAYGNGKISMYADNAIIDKAGANFDIVIGGINENAPEDTIGPEMEAYMNDESFIDGGNTNTSPNLILKLADISGINTSITAVDHDIVAILDGNQSESIVLNDYYETELDDFTKGQVKYQLRDLSVGLHTITIKAWDTYNNSSETTLTFEVVSDNGLVLNNVLNYPNPFVNYTEFWFNHNKPNEPLEVQVQIFTISGKLIKTINQLVQTTGGLSRSITWNGLDDYGAKIGKGVYIYKLKVTSNTNKLSSEKYEKLVIL